MKKKNFRASIVSIVIIMLICTIVGCGSVKEGPCLGVGPNYDARGIQNTNEGAYVLANSCKGMTGEELLGEFSTAKTDEEKQALWEAMKKCKYKNPLLGDNDLDDKLPVGVPIYIPEI